MRTHPFEKQYAFLNSGTAAEKFRAIPKFPVMLDIELTNQCNFHCKMCPTGLGTSSRPRGFMTLDTFNAVLTEAVAHKAVLRFIRWGEPTLHPAWLEWMCTAKARGLGIHFNTNGSLLTKEDFCVLRDAQIDVVKFSFQGVDASSYSQMRDKDFFEKLMEKIALFHSLRGTCPAPFMQISTTVTNESASQIAQFQRRAQAIVDHVNVGFTNLEGLEWLGPRPQLQRPTACCEVFGKLSVDWDGTVTACCNDFNREMTLGTLTRNTLVQLWRCAAQRRYQQLLAAGNFEASNLCRTCFETMSPEYVAE